MVLLYPTLTPEPPEPWPPSALERAEDAVWESTDFNAHDVASPRKLMGPIETERASMLRSNPLDGIPSYTDWTSRHRLSGKARTRSSYASGQQSSSSRFTSSGLTGRSASPNYTTGRNKPREARLAHTPSHTSRAAGSASRASDPGGWAGALASSSGELQQLERQVGALERRLRASAGSASGADVHASAWASADVYGSSETGSAMNDPNPPLPPDPVPVDGGLVLLALAGGTYGWRCLQANDDATEDVT